MMRCGHLFDALHMVVFPALAVMIAVLSFKLIGDAWRDWLDPRTRSQMAAQEFSRRVIFRASRIKCAVARRQIFTSSESRACPGPDSAYAPRFPCLHQSPGIR